jgi:N-acetylmuramoyl-L-alanine amidase
MLLALVAVGGWLGGSAILGQPPKPWIIVIDAGHGGEDTGAIGLGELVEKNLVLDITKIIQIKALNDPQLKILLSRPEDKYVAPQERITLANLERAQLYLSVHANYAQDPFAQGIETLIHDAASPATEALAKLVQKRLSEQTRARDRGVKRAPLYIRDAQMPAVLVEVGFTTNPEEANKLQQLSYQTLIAEAILSAIREYLALPSTK